MHNFVVNLYYEKNITRFGLNRAKIGKNHNIPFFLQSTLQSIFFYDVMRLIFLKCNSFDKFNIKISSKLCNILSSKQKVKNLGFYAILLGVGIDCLPPTITELKILITCIHLNDNIISYPSIPSFYSLIVVHKLQYLSNSEE
jgi:hypothetical protein